MLDEILELKDKIEKDFDGAFISLWEENGLWKIIVCYKGSMISLIELDDFKCLMELHHIKLMLIYMR